MLSLSVVPLKFKEKSDWIIVNNAHKALIGEDVFNEVQSQLSRRKKVVATRKSIVSTLSGLVRCGQCGSGLYIQRKDNGKNLIRNCWYKSPLGEKCINKGMLESDLVEYILEQIRVYRDEIAKGIANKEDGDSAKEAILKEIVELQKELKSVKAKQDKLDEFLEEGVYTKEKYLSRMEKLTAREKDIESEVRLQQHQLKKQEAKKDRDKVEMLDMALVAFEGIEDEEKRNKIMKSLISHIDYTRINAEDKGKIIVNFL